MRTPRHIWAGNWREESDKTEAELAELGPAPDAPTEPQPTTPNATTAPRPPRVPSGPPSASEQAPRPDRRPAIAATAVAVVVLALGGGYLIGHHGGDDSSGAHVAALPAVKSSPIKPTTGQTRAGAIYAKVSPAVVSIRTSSGSGTGFLIDNTTTVVTNAHVVEGARTVTIRFGSEGRDIHANVVGTDPSSDLAVVHLPGGSAPASAKPLGLADSTQVSVGDQVIAIGNPFGLDRTATEGIISGLGRSIQAPNGFSIDDALQTDAPINPGNSGGPLLDQSGHVVGVNSQIETGGTSQGNLGIGFAVPSNTVRSVVPVLERGDHIRRAWLGVSTQETANAGGAQVADVTAGGPASSAGLQVGDVITKIDGADVSDPSTLAKAVADAKPGRKVDIKVRRGGGEQTVSVTLGTRPAQVPSSP